MNSSNAAAIQGWIKAADPRTGRTYYANTLTRKTQWEAPEGWVEETSPPLMPPEEEEDDNEPLPSNWEVMHDPTTGKPFYVDHNSKITQWTRPKVEKKQERSISYAPASTTTTSAAMARILQASSTSTYEQPDKPRSYSQEASYFDHSHLGGGGEVDFSDSMPALDFSVKKVADKYRLECPHCETLFTLSKRRHHCRLCGDVFCDACSSHRVSLPLQGPEFEKPVRICDFCNKDVEQGNFFSMRRYLTPLTLFDPDSGDDDEENGVATPSNVNAALAALTLDLDQMVHNAEGFEEKVTIPSKVLVPTILKHLSSRSNTSDRAVRAVASLLSLGSMVGKNEFAHAVYLYGKRRTMDQILGILERSGSDRKTLFVQEKAAQAIFYLTDSQVLSSINAKRDGLMSSGGNDDDDLGTMESLDIHRCLRNMLDHSSMNKNPNLQRWSAATVRNLVIEDQRRACLAINDGAARVASGEPPSSLEYESFLDQLVSTGGVMILCSLIGADDSDTRAHATGALGATLTATRAIDGAMSALSEMTAGMAGRTDKKDGDIVRAITAGGGCGSSVSQLLLSADNSVAGMGCDFIASLVLPLLIDPQGSSTLSPRYNCRDDPEGMGACREAALEIASGSCLPALVSLVRENGRMTRPTELRKVAMQTLAATAIAVGEMGKAWADGKYEEGMEINGAPATLTRAVTMLNEEQVIDVALEVLKSTSSQSLGSQRDTPAAQIRESAGIILGSLTSCSAETIMELHSRQVLSDLIMAANDQSMTAPSTLRGDCAPRCLGMLEAASAILMFTWQHPSGASSELLDRLIEALDVGAITYLFSVLTFKMDWESRDKSAGGMKARSAACQLSCCLFGIALTDDTAIGMRRLMDACDADQSTRRTTKGPRNVMEAVLTVLQTSLTHAHKMLSGGVDRGLHYQAALSDLVEASLLAAGSMCGSSVAPGGGEGTMIKGDQFLAMRADEFESRRKEVCKVACDVVIRGGRSGPTLLPTMLVGGFGEGAVNSSLRLALAIAQNGSKEQHSKLALSGILVPVSDLLKTALSRGDLYKFSAALALVRFCGPHVAAGTSGGVQSVRDAIRVATNVLTLPINPGASVEQIETQESLKAECISALESLSRNAALWSAISTDALPSIVNYLHSSLEPGSGGLARSETRGTALRAVLEIIQVPSHAVFAAEAGLAEPLGKIIKSINNLKARQQEVDEDTHKLAMEVLHALVNSPAARRHCDLLHGDTLRSVCTAIGYSATGQSEHDVEGRASIAVLGLEILHLVLTDVEAVGETPFVLQSAEAIAFLDAVASEPRFIRSLCATLLAKTGMKVKKHDIDEAVDATFDIPKVYGPPLVLVKKPCAGYEETHSAAAALLFSTSVYACAIESQRSESFWRCALAQDLHKIKDEAECKRSSSTFSALYLKLLTDGYPAFIPKVETKVQDYESLARPLVRYRLLEALKVCLVESTSESVLGQSEIDDFMLSVLVSFNIPYICLSVWKDPALLELSYELIKIMVEAEPEEVLHLFVESKESIASLFDLLNLDSSTEALVKVADIRRFLASTLGKLAENGMLTEAVEKFDVRSSAIAALAAACLTEEEQSTEEEEELTSNRLASGLMQCLVELCTVKDGKSARTLELSQVEAQSIARSLGRKICHMVISRFLERAKMQQYEIEGEEDVMDAPDIALLCAVAQHENALKTLRSIGGFHALAQVAAEGELSAIEALSMGCKDDPLLLLEADTYLSVMSLFSSGKDMLSWRSEPERCRTVEGAAFDLLSQLCGGSAKGRNAVAAADTFRDCFDRALDIVTTLSHRPKPTSSETVSPPLSDKKEPDGDSSEGEEENPTNKEDRGSAGDLPQTGIADAFDINTARDARVLVEAAYGFLSSVVDAPSVRDSLLGDAAFIQCSSSLVSSQELENLQVAAARVLARLAPFASVGKQLSPEYLGEMFQTSLAFESNSTEKKGKWKDPDLYIFAVEGLNVVYDSLSPELQQSALKQVFSRYSKVLKSRSVSRSSTDASEAPKNALLAYHLTTAMVGAVGKDSVKSCYDSTLLQLLASTVQWRYDPRVALNDDEAVCWDAAATQSIQIIAHLLCRDKATNAMSGIKARDLKSNVWMVARAGKAPRKAIDFTSALEVVLTSGGSIGKMAAGKIVNSMTIDM